LVIFSDLLQIILAHNNAMTLNASGTKKMDIHGNYTIQHQKTSISM
jgi:hypothetical protein